MKTQPRKTTKLDIFLLCFSALVILGFMVFYVMYASHQASAPAPVATAQQTPLNADKIFALVNEERLKQGLKPLAIDTEISTVSQVKADDMVVRNYYSHDDPITGKNTIWDSPIWKQKCIYSSENINTGPNPTNENIVSSWMSSKPHHDAILNPVYTTSGIAVSRNIVVQHFCQAK